MDIFEKKTIEEYKQYKFQYFEYKRELDHLAQKWEKTPPIGIILLITSIIAAYLIRIITLWSFNVIFTFWLCGCWILLVICQEDCSNFYRAKSKKHQEIKKRIDLLSGKVKNLLEKIMAFELVVVDNFRLEVEEYYQNNLYRKRSGTAEFHSSLKEFEGLVRQGNIINENLVGKGLTKVIEKYEVYLLQKKLSIDFKDQFKSDFEIKRGNSKVQSFGNSMSALTEVRNKAVPPQEVYARRGYIINWEEINKNKKITGLMGQEIVIEIETNYLKSINRYDLASGIRDMSIEVGDGLGYDILSFFEDGKEKYIEVKSTTISVDEPFYISNNELVFLTNNKESSFIYRLFIDKNNPKNAPEMKIYSIEEVLTGDHLTPISYQVKMN